MNKEISKGNYYILRYIAIITMLCDHLGKVLYMTDTINNETLKVFFVIGRLSFPLFAYLLVESFYYTKNRTKHLLQIFLIAVFSEVIFDMLFMLNKPTNFSTDALNGQNVCFTLAFGWLCLMVTKLDLKERIFRVFKFKKERTAKVLNAFLKCGIISTIILLSAPLSMDYMIIGLILILMLNYARNSKMCKLWQLNSFTVFILTSGNIYYMYAYISLIFVYLASKLRVPKRIENVVASDVSAVCCRFFYSVHLAALLLVKTLLVV